MHHLKGIKVPNNDVSLKKCHAKNVTGIEERNLAGFCNLPRIPYGSFVLTQCIFQFLQLQWQRYRYRGPIFETVIFDFELQLTLRNCWVREIMCLTTKVVPSG